jgi:rhomboid protease GluP
VRYAVHGDRPALRRLALLIPVAAVVLLVLTNNHGVGLAIGCLLGLLPVHHVHQDRERIRAAGA